MLARWDDGEAVSHLFRVAAGLDSLVPGESQILGQVRDAYEAARTRGATGALLNRLFEDALRAGKRVRTEAKLHELPESVAASAVELGVRELGGAEGKRALLFGAGKMSELAARGPARARGAEVVVSSRTLESAQDLAERVGGRAAAVRRGRASSCPRPTSSSPRPAVPTRSCTRRPCGRARSRSCSSTSPCPATSTRRSASSRAARSSTSTRSARGSSAATRTCARPRRSWPRRPRASPTGAARATRADAIRDLRTRAEEIRSEELARAGSRLSELSPRERETVETLTTQIVNKLLHAPTVRAKEAGSEPLRDLFALRDDE